MQLGNGTQNGFVYATGNIVDGGDLNYAGNATAQTNGFTVMPGGSLEDFEASLAADTLTKAISSAASGPRSWPSFRSPHAARAIVTYLAFSPG